MTRLTRLVSSECRDVCNLAHSDHLVISIKLRFPIAFDISSCVFRYLAGSYVLAALVKTEQCALTGEFCRTERDNSFCPN